MRLILSPSETAKFSTRRRPSRRVKQLRAAEEEGSKLVRLPGYSKVPIEWVLISAAAGVSLACMKYYVGTLFSAIRVEMEVHIIVGENT